MKSQKMHGRMFLLVGLLLFTTNVYSQDSTFYVFLCFGQSNMEGQGYIERDDKVGDNRFQVMEAVTCSNLGRTMGSWYRAAPPLCRCYTGLSPVDYFGKTMIANLPSNVRVGVINVSVAGCKIELFERDKYQTYAATVPSWMTGILNEYGGNPYARLVQMAKLAKYDGVINGILLHQGESNVGDNAWPSKVKGIYDNLMTDLSLDPTQVPLLAGEVVNADQGGICAGANSLIAMLPRTIPNSYVISSKGCTDTTDNLHFNSAGYREIGKRYATKMLSLLGIEPTVVHGTKSILIDGYLLGQNYPNPFNPTTTISFSVPTQSFVSLKVFDALGREVSILLSEQLFAGTYSRQWDAAGLSSGVYCYRLSAVPSARRDLISTGGDGQAGSFIETKKLILVR